MLIHAKGKVLCVHQQLTQPLHHHDNIIDEWSFLPYTFSILRFECGRKFGENLKQFFHDVIIDSQLSICKGGVYQVINLLIKVLMRLVTEVLPTQANQAKQYSVQSCFR